jgi:hypothetical protein
MRQFHHRWLKNRVVNELLEKSWLDLPVRPPKHARYLASLLPKAIRVPFIGDVEEKSIRRLWRSLAAQEQLCGIGY